MTVLWYWTTGPKTKTVTVKKLTKTQVVTVDGYGEEERFRRSDGVQLGGASSVMTSEAAQWTIERWHAKEAQRQAGITRRPVASKEPRGGSGRRPQP